MLWPESRTVYRIQSLYLQTDMLPEELLTKICFNYRTAGNIILTQSFVLCMGWEYSVSAFMSCNGCVKCSSLVIELYFIH